MCEELINANNLGTLGVIEAFIFIIFILAIFLVRNNKILAFLVSLIFIAILFVPAGAVIFKGKDFMEKICDLII